MDASLLARHVAAVSMIAMAAFASTACGPRGESTADSGRADSLGAASAGDTLSGVGEHPSSADTASGATSPLSDAAIGRWRLAGTEPFWGVQIDSSGIVYTTPDNQNGIRFPISMPVLADSSLRWNAVTVGSPSHEIEIVITPGDCSDGMSDKTWTHSAAVRVDGTELRGCGERPVP